MIGIIIGGAAVVIAVSLYCCIRVGAEERTGDWKNWTGEQNRMQKKADNQKYAEDKPKDCSYCYFWNSRKNGCSKEECYYRLLPEEPFEEKEETWCCEGCPYGRYSPCIGYCLQKILLEIKQKKAVREKEGDCLAG